MSDITTISICEECGTSDALDSFAERVAHDFLGSAHHPDASTLASSLRSYVPLYAEDIANCGTRSEAASFVMSGYVADFGTTFGIPLGDEDQEFTICDACERCFIDHDGIQS